MHNHVSSIIVSENSFSVLKITYLPPTYARTMIFIKKITIPWLD